MLRLRTLGIAVLVLGLSVAAAPADVLYNLQEVPNTLDGWTTYDLMVDVDGGVPVWDWLGSDIKVALTTGQIYVDPGVAFTPEPVRYLPPNPFQIMGQPTVAFTTYVGAPNMAERGFPGSGIILPETPTVAAFNADPAGGVLDITIFDTPQFQGEQWRLLRLTVSDGAKGTITVQTDYDTTLGVAGGKEEGTPEDIQVGEGPGPEWVGPSAQDIIDGVYPDGIGEDDWNNPANDIPARKGWNNPAREITLSLNTPPGGPITGYSWDFGGGLVKDGATITVTVGELLAAGWEDNPGPPAGNGYTGLITITMTQQDGATDNGQLSMFLPEPGTMSLLIVGCLGTLLRRRRK